ncbi:hypothetical protein LTR37_016279 [Vermiconidia calcicola]|uniref:Uncharacterized protein n=1 Tax=Vermiconidia calcicola TaxID=1690605 RepID=A0ACC3MNA1_9PEZI|nr:hypothetical protein LTR37_016279 [Vermiconidia calcicola]
MAVPIVGRGGSSAVKKSQSASDARDRAGSVLAILKLAHFRYALNFKVPGSRDERRALHFFSTFAAVDMSGLSSCDFWTYTILQRCQHETPLRHATAALGQLHVEYIATPKSSDFTPSHVVTTAYGRAIKSLRNYLGSHANPSRSMVLMCSAVLFCFELVRGERSAASKHLDCGLQVLKHWQNIGPPGHDESPDDMNELSAVFARMDLEATLFDQDRLPVLRYDCDGIADSQLTIQCDDSRLHNFQDLHQSLFRLLYAAMVFLVESVSYKVVDIRQVPERVIRRRKQMVEHLDHWERRADKFEQKTLAGSTSGHLDLDYRKKIAMCRLHCGVMRLLLLHSLADTVKATAPSFDDEADRLLDAAEIAMSPSHGNDSDTPWSNRCFSLHLGVVGPIFLLAMKVYNPSTRESALKVLRAAQGYREGFYDACAMAHTVTALASMGASSEFEDQHIALEWIAEGIEYI